MSEKLEAVKRVFFALQIEEPKVLETLKSLLKSFRENFPSIPWIREENLHLTLQFIGERSPEIIQDISQAVEDIRTHGFRIVLQGLGAFPKLKNARVLWIGTQKQERLLNLQKQIEKRLLKKQLLEKQEFKFHPHITLARLKKPISPSLFRFLEESKKLYIGSAQIQWFYLMQSQMTGISKKQVHYKKLHSFPLVE